MFFDKTYQIGTCTSGGNILCEDAEDRCVNFTRLKAYLYKIPQDVSVGSPETTGFSVMISDDMSVTATACKPEGNEPIIWKR